MANNHGGSNSHGGSGSKFMSVNLNKLYGQPSHNKYPPDSGTYGPGVGTNRARLGGHASAGGGMVVLSRNRPLQKAMPKLSVPPPLNLPSLRKEYEKIDSSGAGGGVAGGAGLGSGSKPSSSGMGWTKPGNVTLQEKEVSSDIQVSESVNYNVGATPKGSGTYMPPSARFGGGLGHGDMVSSHHSNASPLKRAIVLRGEDFPSLRAALPVSTGPAQKQNGGSFQKLKQLVGEESSNDLRNSSHFNSLVHVQSSYRVANGVNENSGQAPISSSARVDHAQKQEDFLPLVWLNPRSDWADDERDTSHGFVDRSGRDQELPKSETYWDKGLSINDQLLNFGREKSSFAKSERTYLDDPYQKDFSSSVYDERDPITGNLVGVVKRKKVVTKQTDFHDPVRESFEAELERVQKMQEMERQMIVEEQKSALEQTRREDEERWRVVIEEEERRRRMEEEAREAAGRVEQEKIEAIHKAEELKIDREEEKKRMLLEEERRKQAAKQKLLELEARMAKRQAEVGKTDNTVHTGAEDEVPVGGKDSDASMDSDLDNWEISQRMVETITTSASSDASAMDRPFDQPIFSREASSSFVDRGKPVNPWKRDAFEVGSNSSFLLNDQVNGHHSTRREASSIGGRSFPRKDVYGGGYTSSRSPFRGAIQNPYIDGFPHLGDRDQRWNSFGDGEPYGPSRDIESEFYNDNAGEKYGEAGWGQGHSRGNTRSLYSDKLYLNSYGRSPYSMRQPGVLPPSSLTSTPKSLELTARTGNYGGPQDKNEMLRCDSQSSLSVSSPPSSPTHLSNDELDDSGGCSVIATAAEGKEPLEHDLVNDEPTVAASKSVSADEDEEWSLENHDEMQEHEEYDEDDGYGEVDEVHEGPDVNINLTQEFEHMHLEEKNTTNGMENLVLGFNEGVEVRLPVDKFERDLKTDGDTIDKPEVPVGVVEKQAEIDVVNREQPQNAHISGSSSLLGVPSMVSSAVEMASSSSVGQSTTLVPSSFPNQTDLPVKLQFGLFSGLSLIPSPFPSIQIGSIQMPLHLHPSVGSSMAHIHPSQPPPPLFQFGQLRYTSPVSQGILPMNSQPMSLVQPNGHHPHFSLYQNSASSLSNQFAQENPAINTKDTGGSPNLLNNQSGNVSKPPNPTHENWTARGNVEYNAMVRNSQSNMPNAADNRIASKQVAQTEEKGHATSSYAGPSEGKNVPMSKAQGPSSANRGRTNAYPARNSGSRSFQPYDPSGSNEFQRKHRHPIQRTEFRVRENDDRRQNLGVGSFYNSGSDDKFNRGMGSSTRSGYRRHMGSITSLKHVIPETSGSQEIVSEKRPGKKLEDQQQQKLRLPHHLLVKAT